MWQLSLCMTLDKMAIAVSVVDPVVQEVVIIALVKSKDRKWLERLGKTPQCKRLCDDYYSAWLRLNQWSEMTQRGGLLNNN